MTIRPLPLRPDRPERSARAPRPGIIALGGVLALGALATAFLGFAYTQKGEADPAIAALEQAIPLVHRFGLHAYDAWFTAFLAEAHRLAGPASR